MELTDVRRLTGANLIMDRCGAVGEAALPGDRAGLLVALWRREAQALLAAVGWAEETTFVRAFPGGASLAVSAPLDGLYAATDLIEAAWAAVMARLNDEEPADLDTVAAALRGLIAEEANPDLRALEAAAKTRGLTFLSGEDLVSVGLGTGVQSWPEEAVPAVDTVDWPASHDIPLALVTGTNGKSTTVRLTAAIAAAAGCTVGLCSSDWVKVAGEVIDEGDYSGPGGARRAVRDPRVDLAVLEVARGGLLRRGLSLPRAPVCAITNVAADHLGEYGITDLPSLCEAKFLLARAVAPGGRLVLNADDPALVRRSMDFSGEITWFSLTPEASGIPAWLAAGGRAAVLEDGRLMLARGEARRPILTVSDYPLGLDGAARFNLANALAAIAIADALDLPPAAMAAGLAGFKGGPDENPGRGNFLDLGGVTVLVDFAHNTDGLAALIEAIVDLPAKRRLLLLGHAGDRRDEDIRALARTAWQLRPERLIVKEMEGVLRGRALGEVPALMAQELEALGAPTDAVTHAASELQGVRDALAWAAAGDFLVLLLHSERKAGLALLQDLQDREWQAGQPLPGAA